MYLTTDKNPVNPKTAETIAIAIAPRISVGLSTGVAGSVGGSRSDHSLDWMGEASALNPDSARFAKRPGTSAQCPSSTLHPRITSRQGRFGDITRNMGGKLRCRIEVIEH